MAVNNGKSEKTSRWRYRRSGNSAVSLVCLGRARAERVFIGSRYSSSCPATAAPGSRSVARAAPYQRGCGYLSGSDRLAARPAQRSPSGPRDADPTSPHCRGTRPRTRWDDGALDVRVLDMGSWDVRAGGAACPTGWAPTQLAAGRVQPQVAAQDRSADTAQTSEGACRNARRRNPLPRRPCTAPLRGQPALAG